MAGTAFRDSGLPFFVAGAAFRDSVLTFYVAGTAFGDSVLAVFVALQVSWQVQHVVILPLHFLLLSNFF